MHTRLPWALAVPFAMLTMSACNPQQTATPSADARLQKIYAEEWQWREQQYPDTEDAQKPIQDHLTKVDPAAQAARLQMWQEVQKKLDAIPRAELDRKSVV